MTNKTADMKKIYFAGSIRGGRIDADLYRRIIEYMKRTRHGSVKATS